MDYKKHYNLLITRAQNRLLEGYSESHHIIPRCIGGNNDNSNLVLLTPEEHYLAHLLLVKIHPNNHKLIFAAHMMTVDPLKRNQRGSNKIYGWMRRKMANYMSNRVISEETRKKMSVSNSNRIWKESSRQKVREWTTNNNPMNNPHSIQKLKDLIWINDGIKNKRIPNTQSIPNGFKRGRIMPEGSKATMIKPGHKNELRWGNS